MDDSLHTLSAAEGIRKIQAGEITAADWMSSCVSRIKAVEPSVQAWAYFNEETAMEQAESFDRRRQSHAGVLPCLSGLPVGIKDIFNTKDMPTAMGSPLWDGFMPGNDARTVYLLREAGALVAGKTVTAEFAVHAPGKTRNPANLKYSPGTSSSGSAAAVACGMVPAALGTQTAGSILRPASYCGVFGFKPTFGVIPRTGTLKTTDSLDTIGFFAGTAEDLALVFDAARVSGQDYPVSTAFLEQDKKAARTRQKWKIALVTETLDVWRHASPHAAEQLHRLAEDLRQSGAEIEIKEAVLPGEFNDAHQIHQTIYDKTLSYYFKEEFKNHTLISKIMYEIIERGARVSLQEYREALEKQNRLTRKLHEFFEGRDAILTLSTAGETPLFGQDDVPDSCLIWTLCGAPSVSVPALRNKEGLPLGIQLVGKKYTDYSLLRLASTIQRELITTQRTIEYGLPQNLVS